MKASDIGILIVDDEASVRDALHQWFEFDGYRVDSAADATIALQKLQDALWDIVLLDIKMPGMDGLELQRRIKEIDKHIITIMITAFASVDTSIQALKEGAFDYIVKPVDPDDMAHLIRNAVEQRRLYYENRQLRSQLEELNTTDRIVGQSEQLKAVLDKVARVAPTDSTVMIRGESGTGKELIARAIHTNSNRRYFPFITLNCGAYTEGLLESERFGHEKGAFTGALYQRRGKLEMADMGTLFLDEIGNIGVKMQMDLLRMIETSQFCRLGGDQSIEVDFRIICATHKDLEAAVRNGTFCDDLYYRLNVFSIALPPLRERTDDIACLARFFVDKYAQAMNKGVMEIAPEIIELLECYSWPGNVRELKNAMERSVVSARGSTITPADLSFPLPASPGDTLDESSSLEEVERRHIKKILRKTGGNIDRAASMLKISRLALDEKISKYELKI